MPDKPHIIYINPNIRPYQAITDERRAGLAFSPFANSILLGAIWFSAGVILIDWFVRITIDHSRRMK